MKKALLIPALFLSFVCHSQNHIFFSIYSSKINPSLFSNGLLSRDISNSQDLRSYNSGRLWLLKLSPNSNENSIMIDRFTSPFNNIDYNKTLGDLKQALKGYTPLPTPHPRTPRPVYSKP